jgi:hypothetical protein
MRDAETPNERERADKLEGFLRTLAECLRIAAADLLEADPPILGPQRNFARVGH